MDTEQPTWEDGKSHDTTPTSEAVVQAVATRTDTDAMALPPLFDRIDPDAIDALFEPTRTGFTRSGRLEFEYAGHLVTVSVDETGTRSIELEDVPAAIASDDRFVSR